MGVLRNEWVDLFVLAGLIALAGIAGNSVGYWTGKQVGPAMYQWRDRLLFKKRYLIQARDFYEKHGGKTIIIARFIPIIRTFAPFVAGVGAMTYSKFIMYNIVGGVLWCALFIYGGYFFGNLPIVKNKNV